jgi:hypothetical protein
LANGFENRNTARIAAILFDLREAAEVEVHLAQCCVPTHAGAHVFVGLLFLMETQLIIELCLDL